MQADAPFAVVKSLNAPKLFQRKQLTLNEINISSRYCLVLKVRRVIKYVLLLSKGNLLYLLFTEEMQFCVIKRVKGLRDFPLSTQGSTRIYY